MKFLKILIIMSMIAVSKTIQSDTVPITSKEFAIENITRFELRRLYFMKDRWVEGIGLVCLYQRPPHSDAHLRFIRETLGLTPSEYFKQLALMVNSGKGAVITVVGSDEDMIAKVTEKDNALGYLDVDTLIINLDKSTKFLKVIDE